MEEECSPGGAARGGQGARPGGEVGWAGVASAPGRARPGRRRAPACAHRAEAEGRHPLPGLGGGPRQARGRELGRRAPAGWRVTRSSPFPLSLPVADAAAPAAPRAEDWTAEPRAAAAAERTPDAVTPCPGAGARASLVGAAPALLLPPFSPPSPPLPAPRPRTRRTSSGDGAGGGRAAAPPRPLLLRPLERFVKLPIPPAARSSSSSSFTTSSSSASSSPRAPPSPRLPRPPSFFPPHVRGSRRSAERGGRGEPGRSSILRAAALRGGG